MMKGISIFRRDGVLPITIAVVVSVLFVVGSTSGATTISTDITTGGNVNATGTLQATGAVTTYGAGTFGDAAGDFQIFGGQLQASSTALFGGAVTTYGASTFGDAATDINIFTGTLQASTTALFTGAVTTYGNATLGDTVSDSVTANAYFTQLRIGTGSTFGNIDTVGADELGVEGAVEIDGAAYLDGAVYASSTLQATGDVVLYGGDGALTLTTTNAATSTLVVGCIQTYATSTASPIKLTIGSSGATTTFAGVGSISSGVVTWNFGSCP